MAGVITLRHVLAHPVLVVRGFGLAVFFRAVLAGARRAAGGPAVTFLSLL